MDVLERKKLAESLRGREVRRVPVSGLELREGADGTLTMEGWASVTEREYDMGYYTEVVKRGAFAKTLGEAPDVQLLLNHEGLPLARTVSGTLQLQEDSRGLHVNASLSPDDPDVQRLAPKVKRGDIDQMSFAFRAVRQEWDDEYTNRQLLEVNIDRGDVSIVNQGANPATSFSLRDATDMLTKMSRDEFVTFMRSIHPEVSDLAGEPTTEDLSPEALVRRIAELEARLAAQTTTPTEPVVATEPAANDADTGPTRLDFYTRRAQAYALRGRA